MATEQTALLETFKAVCADPYGPARMAEAQGRKVAGFMCSYAPRELFHAAGYLPVRILGRAGGTPKADEHLQAYTCSFARSSFDAALSGEMDFLDVVVFSHTCDTLQNLADIWRKNMPDKTVLIHSLPNLMTGVHARNYYRKELDRVRAAIEVVTGPIPEGVLMNSIRLHRAHTMLMNRLYAIRREKPGVLSGNDMAHVILSSFLMDIEKHFELLATLVDSIDPIAGDSNTKPRVLVAGSVCQNLDFIATIEAAGCVVVDDDLCMGSRSFVLADVDESDPMDALLQSYMSRPPCPAFHKPGFDPGAYLLQRAQAVQAAGVVFLQTKFCDPCAFDYVPINRTLEAANIPTLLLEVEQNNPASEQFRTRAEAFVEILHARAGA